VWIENAKGGVEIGDCRVWIETAMGGEWMCEADSSKTAVMLKEVATVQHTLTVRSRSGKTCLACLETPVPLTARAV
jgi:VCBS repeat-containing protein